ncbi:MAG: DMT family transporter [Rhodospirillales bacterium]|nr:DMT family transporter [Rhodospirillales bacterium]
MNTIGTLASQVSESRRGILWFLFAVLVFSTMDVVAKHLTAHYPIPQIVWARHTLPLLVLAVVLNRRLPGFLTSRRVGLQVARSCLLLGASVCFYFALRVLTLADATAVTFVGPLLAVAMSVPLLGEWVGPRRWTGVLIGFVGALIIIRPGTGVMKFAAFLPLGAALCFALYQIATRRLRGIDGPVTTLAFMAVTGTVVTSAIVPFFWILPDLAGGLLMGSLGMLGTTGHFALIKAFESAPVSVIAPFDYTALIWAALFGYFIFNEMPDTFTILGALVITGSGLYILRRESVRSVVAPEVPGNAGTGPGASR